MIKTISVLFVVALFAGYNSTLYAASDMSGDITLIKAKTKAKPKPKPKSDDEYVFVDPGVGYIGSY
ncbi:MAG: hypothetical protein F9K49_04820 [Caedimonadaceae bacterium]|nr:MAG: hypothetical protein F9K49_04820 [Caedimonadaceae bacterium]